MGFKAETTIGYLDNNMVNSSLQIAISRNERNNKITFFLIFAYFIIRILLRLIIFCCSPLPEWTIPLFEFFLYLFIAVLIGREKDTLRDFNFDRFSLVLFLLCGTILQTINLTNYAFIIISLSFWIIAIGLVIIIRSSFSRLPKFQLNDLFWILRGIALSLILSVILATPWLITRHGNSLGSQQVNSNILSSFFLIFIYQLGHSAVLEEPIFRGFLWGYLRNLGWKENRIWISQAILFWLAHFYYIDRPYSFWVVTPIMGLALGWLVLRSKSIAPSMIAHSIFNTMAFIFPELL